MLNCQFDESKKMLFLHGRIDAQTSTLFEKELNDLVRRGQREIFIDCADIQHISSAGLRVFLSIQKQLKQISGGIVLCQPSEPMLKVFAISGFDKLFDMILGNEELTAKTGQKQKLRQQKVLNGIPFECVTGEPVLGTWAALGASKDSNAEFYGPDDAEAISADRMRFGCGLSAPGNSFEDCKNFIGECVAVDGNYFYYPAIKNAAVDFILGKEADAHLNYQFFSGFRFDGKPSHTLSFSLSEAGSSLAECLKGLSELVETNVFAVVGVLESAGIWGMNFKKAPIAENFPKSGSMRDKDNFSEFMDFPIEASFRDHIIVAAGLTYKDKQRLSEESKRLFPEESASHLHGVIMEKGPVSRNSADFHREIDRVLMELKPLKVQHLLQKSRFKGGLLGVMLLEER